MLLKQIKEVLNAQLFTCSELLERDVKYVFGCDLMSDVLALVSKDTILLTGLANIQAIRTAEMMDIKCIIFVRGKVPNEQMISLANEKGICLMSTEKIMFTACGILYNYDLEGAERD